jgi:hypothetical protein
MNLSLCLYPYISADIPIKYILILKHRMYNPVPHFQKKKIKR